MALKAVVRTPPAAPPRVGLVASAPRVDEPDDRWIAGFNYHPESCPTSGVADACASATKEIGDAPDNVVFDPFYIFAGDKCSALGFSDRDFIGRARRFVEACTSKELEKEFWTGTLAKAADPDTRMADNRFLASPDSDVLSNGPMTLLDGLACLEQALGDCNCGARGMIHATRQTVTYWANAQLVRREAGLILTINDTIVVPGAGYDGSGPDGQAAAEGSAWAYATGEVEVRLSSIDIYPTTLAEALNRDDNTVTFLGERAAAATWDGCCHAAVELDVPLCGIAGS